MAFLRDPEDSLSERRPSVGEECWGEPHQAARLLLTPAAARLLLTPALEVHSFSKMMCSGGPRPFGSSLLPALEGPLDRAPLCPPDEAGSPLRLPRSLCPVIHALIRFS